MTIANILRVGFGAAIALGLLFEQPTMSESVAREAEAEAVIEAITPGCHSLAPVRRSSAPTE